MCGMSVRAAKREISDTSKAVAERKSSRDGEIAMASHTQKENTGATCCASVLLHTVMRMLVLINASVHTCVNGVACSLLCRRRGP